MRVSSDIELAMDFQMRMKRATLISHAVRTSSAKQRKQARAQRKNENTQCQLDLRVSHVTYEYVMPLMNEQYHIGMRLVTYSNVSHSASMCV